MFVDCYENHGVETLRLVEGKFLMSKLFDKGSVTLNEGEKAEIVMQYNNT